MINKPKFSLSMSYEEFKQHYWYKNELAKICSEYGISSTGTKADLELKIEKLLDNKVDKKTTVRFKSSSEFCKPKFKSKNSELTLESSLLDSGFKFNEKTRTFFASVLGLEKFKFNKQMAALMREVKRNNDREVKVKDLLSVYLENKSSSKNERTKLPDYMVPEEQTYQWNNFVKDFNKDHCSKKFKNKMKVAALLWSKVRDRPGSKKYTSDLINEYEKEVKELQEKYINEKQT